MSLLKTLTEGIRMPDRNKDVNGLVKKWKQIGLLDGLTSKWDRLQFAKMFESTAKQMLTQLNEISTMSGGNVEGYATTLFPIIRKSYGKAIARKLVSMQAMSLPTQLIFFLDFTFNDNRLGGNEQGLSVFGGGRVGAEQTKGFLTEDSGSTRYGERGFYSLNNGYSAASGSITASVNDVTELKSVWQVGASEADDIYVDYDPDLSGSYATVVRVALSAAEWATIPTNNLVPIIAEILQAGDDGVFASGSTQVRRLNKKRGTYLDVVFAATASFSSIVDAATDTYLRTPLKDAFTAGTSLGTIVGTSAWQLENQTAIPELNLKINSVSITAYTRKIKTTWTQELEKDMDALQSLDAESELNDIMSQHVELEVNYEILEDLVKGATCGVRYWSRNPGKFVNKITGLDVSNTTTPPDFTGGVREWYQTLLETINDLGALMHRKVRRGGPTFLVTSPEVISIMEMVTGFSANVSFDDETGEAGVFKAGSIRKKWDIYVDPHFYRNLILVGRKGNSQFETGYAFCPYVPYYVMPTLFHPESGVPRKIAWMRYGKIMLLPDFYGLVVIEDLLG